MTLEQKPTETAKAALERAIVTLLQVSRGDCDEFGRRAELSEGEVTLAIDALIAAVRAESQPAWQSIETAPKDGTVIMLLEPKELSGRTRYGRVSIGRWCVTRQYAVGGYWEDDAFTGVSQPTHWMPLLDPPVVGT